MSQPLAVPVLVFDGVCGLCHRWVRFVLRHDAADQVHFAAVQSVPGQALLARHGVAHLAFDTLVFIDDDQAYVRSEAVLRILARLPRPWRWARVLRVIPVRWRDHLYNAVARRRYRLFGRYDQCVLPDPEQRVRFLHE